MIPKKIHYVWVWEKEIPKLEKKCIESRKKYLPDYELCLWNETNFDLNINNFVKDAYKSKKYAFVSDFIRIWALYNYGWVYLDTDVEVIKNLDKFLKHKWFWWFEWKDLITTWVIWAEKWNPFIKEILNYYDNAKFDINNLIPNPEIITNVAKNKFWFKWWNNKKVTLDNEEYIIYPENYFCPKGNRFMCTINKNCYVIHHFSWSWMNYSSSIKILRSIITKTLKFFWLYGIFLKIWKHVRYKKN
jgi:mannosyltransferase OCH1-like enzyme